MTNPPDIDLSVPRIFDEYWSCDVCDARKHPDALAYESFTDQGWAVYVCDRCFVVASLTRVEQVIGRLLLMLERGPTDRH